MPLSVMPCVEGCRLHAVTFLPVPGSGGGGQQPGAVVVPAGDGLVAPRQADQRSANARRARVISPAASLPGQAGQPGGLGDGQLDGARPGGRAGRGRPAQARRGEDKRGQGGNASVGVAAAVAGGAGWLWGAAGQAALGRCGWQRRGAGRGRPGRCAGHCRVPVRTWEVSQPSMSFPVLKVSSTGHLRPAMVMKYVIVAGWSCGAQHR